MVSLRASSKGHSNYLSFIATRISQLWSQCDFDLKSNFQANLLRSPSVSCDVFWRGKHDGDLILLLPPTSKRSLFATKKKSGKHKFTFADPLRLNYYVNWNVTKSVNGALQDYVMFSFGFPLARWGFEIIDYRKMCFTENLTFVDLW